MSSSASEATPLEDGRKLPAQVVGVLDRAGQPQATRRRMPVRGVADEEHPAHAQARRDDALEGPPGDLVDLDRVIAHAEGGTRMSASTWASSRARGSSKG